MINVIIQMDLYVEMRDRETGVDGAINERSIRRLLHEMR